MITILILFGIPTVFLIGAVKVFNRHSKFVKEIDFANKYRNKFNQFANKYFQSYGRFNSISGEFDGELYVWLTMNVNKIQGNLGTFGLVNYVAPFQTYKVSNYQIVLNAIPKFRDGSVKDFDTHWVDDCLLRYIGHLEENSKEIKKNLRNPIVWFSEGIKEILSIPIIILGWFGIISNRTIDSVKDSLIYRVISGLVALVAFISGVVTIVLGYEQTVEFLMRLIGK